MGYIDGYVIPVKSAEPDVYTEFAKTYAPLFKKYGATRVVEGWGVNLPDGKHTDFSKAVAAKDDETVVFSWVEWPDKATRDEGMALAVKDPAFTDESVKMPFDGKRMIMGEFAVIVDE